MKWPAMRWEPHLQPSVCSSASQGGERLHLEKGGGKSVIYNKREKDVQKASQSAAGELWLPVQGNFLASCGCKAVMHHWHSRPQPLTKNSWTQQETPQWEMDNNATSTKRETTLNNKLHITDVNHNLKSGKTRTKSKAKQKKTINMQKRTN